MRSGSTAEALATSNMANSPPAIVRGIAFAVGASEWSVAAEPVTLGKDLGWPDEPPRIGASQAQRGVVALGARTGHPRSPARGTRP